jgi:ribosome-associated protein
MIQIKDKISISENELTFLTSRSGGPGGQHVNKVSTKVTVLFDIKNSTAFSDEEKRRILTRLARRINREGAIQVTAQTHRSQSANRNEALSRLIILLRQSLHKPRRRKKTSVPASAILRRLSEKKHRGLIKSRRKKVPAERGDV